MSASSATSVNPAANGSGYGASPSQLPPPKQIRFVNIEGPPPMKRRRIDAALAGNEKRDVTAEDHCALPVRTMYMNVIRYEEGPMKKDRHSSDAGIRRDNGDEEHKEETTSAE
ncbi:hypothetical protein B2J93_9180 [Marssonina coronariae]|uniref:Uncharacterized protein n=1 Tax=Diplocarpon coronariae TaxID=2795749 RepID=A0A218ZEF4_9HELO|nr:hypothetical protein B2J93_9180 [Marssonina coronariae]